MTQTPSLGRRSFLGLTAAGLGTLAVGGALPGSPAYAAPGRPSTAFGYGPLVPDPKGLLDLPQGFTYRVVAVSNDVMSAAGPVAPTKLTDGGENSPSRYDGTGSFVRHGGAGAVLVSNHENGTTAKFPVPHRAGLTYDEGAATGGTTTLTVDKDGNRVSEVVSLAGTISNCAGGMTPWQTWLSCEETELRAGQSGTTKDHGYVFEVDPYDMAKNRNPKPIKAFGRFPHEAIVVDPQSGATYSTEDAGGPNGLLYRWTGPKTRDFRTLADDAGVLEAMYCTDQAGKFVPDLAAASTLGTTYKVQWKRVPDRDAKTVSTRKQFTWTDPKTKVTTTTAAGDITRSRKLEGMWWGDGGFYFDASYARLSDGSVAEHDGQVWFFDPKAQTITLKVYFPKTADQNVDPDGPDNLTVSPYGGLVLCEDGDGDNHLVLASDSGEWAFFARNHQDSEMAGANFSPNHKTLFANSQDPGVVFAITGPWRKH